MRVIRFFLIVALVCTLLIGAALGIGHLLPMSSDPSVLARNPCALPCFYGITPGQTTRSQAITLLAQYVEPTQVSDDLLTFPLVDHEGRAALASVNFDPSGQVASIRLTAIDFFANIGQLSDLLEQKPRRVFRTCNYVLPVRFLMTFGAQDELLIELFPFGDLAPNTPITLFDLSTAASRSLYDARASFGCSVEARWQGFAPLWRYITSDQ